MVNVYIYTTTTNYYNIDKNSRTQFKSVPKSNTIYNLATEKEASPVLYFCLCVDLFFLTETTKVSSKKALKISPPKTYRLLTKIFPPKISSPLNLSISSSWRNFVPNYHLKSLLQDNYKIIAKDLI